MPYSYPLRLIALPILVALVALATPARAAETEPIVAQLVFNNTQDPAETFAGSGRPVSRSAGGSRGDCDEQLVALLPGSDTLTTSATGCSSESTADLALTTSATPVLWVHVPTLANPTDGELALLDENQQALAVQTISLSGAAGIVGIPVGTTLEVNRTYYWVFTVLDETVKRSENIWVEGALRRIEPDADWVTALNQTDDPRDQAAIWAQQGIWHDALTALAELRRISPDNGAANQDWQHFLASVGLGAIAHAPIQDCCY